MMSGRKLRILHCADLHLDSPFYGISDISPSLGSFLRKASFRAFENAVSHAIASKTDFFLVSGDIYDGEDRSVRAQVFFLEQLKRLSGAGIPSFIAAGNHDSLSGWEADRDFPPLAVRFGPDVESFPLVTAGGERVGTIHGYSFPVRNVEENIALRFAQRHGEGVNIAMLHCNTGGRKGHENFAPCSLDDLKSAGMDYWALGHVHTAEILCRTPLIAYPGIIQGRHARESGEKGVYEAVLTTPSGSLPASAVAEFVPCDAVRWRSEHLSISGMDRDEDFFQALAGLKEEARNGAGGRPVILRVALSGRGRVHEMLRRPGFLRGSGGLMDTLNAQEAEHPDFVHTVGISDTTAPELDLEFLSAGEHFVGDFLKEVRSFTKRGDLREGMMDILRERGLLDKIRQSGDVLERIESLSEDEVGELLDRCVFSTLSGLLEGEPGL